MLAIFSEAIDDDDEELYMVKVNVRGSKRCVVNTNNRTKCHEVL